MEITGQLKACAQIVFLGRDGGGGICFIMTVKVLWKHQGKHLLGTHSVQALWRGCRASQDACSGGAKAESERILEEGS